VGKAFFHTRDFGQAGESVVGALVGSAVDREGSELFGAFRFSHQANVVFVLVVLDGSRRSLSMTVGDRLQEVVRSEVEAIEFIEIHPDPKRRIDVSTECEISDSRKSRELVEK